MLSGTTIELSEEEREALEAKREKERKAARKHRQKEIDQTDALTEQVAALRLKVEEMKLEVEVRRKENEILAPQVIFLRQFLLDSVPSACPAERSESDEIMEPMILPEVDHFIL